MPRRQLIRIGEGPELLFEFCVEGIARTARRHRDGEPLRIWKDRVRAGARATLAGSAMLEGPIELRITEFSEVRTKDRDNIVKPIQDAMEGVLFRNDRQVARLESDWSDINGRFEVRYMSEVAAAALVIGREFVWIRIRHHRPRESLIS